MTKRQQKALKMVRRTLLGIDGKKFWKRVMDRVGPKRDANALVRAKSLWKDGHHSVRESDSERRRRFDRWWKTFRDVQRRTAKSTLQFD